MMAAREDDAPSEREAEEQDSSSPGATDQKADEAVAPPAAAGAAEVDDCSDDDDPDPVIRNLNLMSRLNVMTPEWIENRKRLHYEEVELFNRAYDALEKDDLSSDDEDDAAEYEEWSKQLRELVVDWTGLNTVGGESRGMDAEAVYPDGLYPPEEADAPAAAAESSS